MSAQDCHRIVAVAPHGGNFVVADYRTASRSSFCYLLPHWRLDALRSMSRSAIAQWMRGESTLATLVLIELRLPRTVLAVLVGASLGLAGAALQGLLRNPLAEPGIIGVSSCAALGAVIAFYSGASFAAPLALPFGGHRRCVGRGRIAVRAGWTRGEHADSDSRGCCDQRFCRGCNSAGAKPCAESVCSDGNRVLDDGIACRSQRQSPAARRTADDRRLGTAVDQRPRARRTDAG